MGKSGSCFSAIKRVFTPLCKEKLGNQEPERKSGKEKKKKGFGKLRHGETNSFLPIFREPSSIENILGEAERDHNLVFKPPTTSDRSRPASPQVASPQTATPRTDLSRSVLPKSPDQSKPSSASANAPPPLRPASTRVPSQRSASPIVHSPRPAPPVVASPQVVPLKPPSPGADPPRLDTLRPPSPEPPSPRLDPPRLETPRPPSPKPHSPRAVSPRAVHQREIVYRPEPSLLVQHASATRIQGAFRGYMARRSFRALKGLVRLQGVVRGYSVKRQTINAMKYMQQLVRIQSQIQSRRIKMLENQAQVERDEAKWGASEASVDNWDDSVLTKEERDATSQRKIKRERSMAYAYSHKLWKNSPKSAHSSGGFPLWWNWVDRQLHLTSPVRSHSQPLRDSKLKPTRLIPSPLSQSSNQHHFRLDNSFDTSTPISSRSTLLTPSRPIHTGMSRYSRGRLRGLDSPFKDDDSLRSCPPFPRYMAPTVSAKSKVRPSSNPKERIMGTTPVSNQKKRMSFPPTQQGHDMFRWNKGSLHMSNSSNYKGLGSPGGVVLEKHKALKSVGNLSIDSTVSMPDTVGRKPFNRYV